MSDKEILNLRPGTIINGRYEVVKCLGTGSMGMVYACRHRDLKDHIVAMKVLFSEMARDEVAAARFRNEIVASYGVNHPNVVRAYEYFRDGDLIAFTMEFVGGGDLADKIGSPERVAISKSIRYLIQMCSGLQAIHNAGIIHRDLKPENVLLTEGDDVKITDFGIARTGTGPKLTEYGGVVGTIDYVSPEYLEKGQVDSLSDIYSMGVLAYELITGESPFKGQSVIETMTMRLRSDPDSPTSRRLDCPESLSKIILKALSREPSTRYQSAMEMLRDLVEVEAELGFPKTEYIGPEEVGDLSGLDIDEVDSVLEKESELAGSPKQVDSSPANETSASPSNDEISQALGSLKPEQPPENSLSALELAMSGSSLPSAGIGSSASASEVGSSSISNSPLSSKLSGEPRAQTISPSQSSDRVTRVAATRAATVQLNQKEVEEIKNDLEVGLDSLSTRNLNGEPSSPSLENSYPKSIQESVPAISDPINSIKNEFRTNYNGEQAVPVGPVGVSKAGIGSERVQELSSDIHPRPESFLVSTLKNIFIVLAGFAIGTLIYSALVQYGAGETAQELLEKLREFVA